MKTHRLLVAGVALVTPCVATAQLSVSSDLLSAADLDRATVQELELPAEAGEPFDVEVRLHGGLYNLALEPHSLRAPNFQLLAQGADGSYTEMEPRAETTYRGVIEGMEGSAVAASLIDGQLHALVRFAEDLPLLGIQPVSALEFEGAAGASIADHAVFDAADIRPMDVTCGSEHMTTVIHPQANPSTAAGGIKECEIAVDADFEFFQKSNSSVFSAEQDIASIINGVAGIYLTDVGMSFLITAIIVRTAEPDPYTSTSGSTLLNQLTNHWSGSQGAIQRDIAHLFTGKNINGSTIGIAWLNSVCGNSNGYGVSQSKFSGNFASRVALTAHEIGHNFAAGHCDGGGGCAIMCSGLGGCSGNITFFGNQSKNAISNKINSSGCLDDAAPSSPPVLNSASPGVVSSYLGNDLLITGSNFSEVLQVKVGNSIMPLSKTSVSFSQITVFDPVIKDAGSNEVVVTSTAGAGGGEFISVLETTAINLDAPAVVVPGLSLFIPWSGGGGNQYSFNFAFDDTTIDVGGEDVLLNSFVGQSGTFGSGGTEFLLYENVGSFGFLTLYFQVLVFDASGTVFLGASPVKQTVFI